VGAFDELVETTMKNYQVLVYGRNFRMPWQEARGIARLRLTGFFATRFVRARDREDAELRAMDLIRSDKDLKAAVQNPQSDPPLMFAESIVEVQRFKSAGRGYIFFHGRGAGRPRAVPRRTRSRTQRR